MKLSARNLTLYAIMTSLALVLSFVETLIPFTPLVPGMKIGLANLVTMLLLYTAGPVSAVIVSILRILLSGILFGNMFSVCYSFSGFVFSFLSMLLLKRTGKFGISAVSCVGGVMHNLGQLVFAALIAGRSVFAYAPFLFLSGVLSGAVIGIIGGILVQRLKSVIE